MSLLRRWRRWRSNAELDEEIQTHLELETQIHLERGLSADEALAAAQRQFGNATLVKERAHEADPFARLEIFLKDVRHAARSLRRAPGFTLAALLTLALGIGANAAIYQIFDAVLLRPLPVPNAEERIASAPGVESVAEVRHVPLGGTGTGFSVRLAGADAAGEQPMAFNAMSEEYLDTMRIPLLAGRNFERRDEGTPVAIVNEAFAARLALENPIGKRFRIDDPDIVFDVIGYVPDTKYSRLRENPVPIAFVPTGLIRDPRPYTDFMIRSAQPAGASEAVRGAIRDVSPLIRTDIRPFNATIRAGLLPERLLATLAGFFGILAVLIAAVGLYGVISYLIVRRTTEIGVRMALGATRRDVLTMVLAQAARLVAIGCAAGSVLALVAARWAQSLVFGLEPRSVGTVGLACLLLAFVAAAACSVPALRAARVEPRDALHG